MILDEKDYLAHYGILRKSGRYPWGSGATQSARNQTFLDTVAELKGQGMTESEIATGFGMNTTQLRALKSIAKQEQKQDQIRQAAKLKEHGLSNVAIGEKMGLNESSVRSLLAPSAKDKADVLEATTDMLRKAIDEKGYIDVGTGVNLGLGVSNDKLKVAVAKLQEEGYKKHYLQVQQLGTGNKTSIQALGAPGSKYPKQDQIQQLQDHSPDGGRTYQGPKSPISISSKRVAVRYDEDGGSQADGVIYVRPGVKDVSIGASQYAQVRIAIDGTHYLKGMAVYKKDLPDGVDLVFNTNKKNSGNKLDAMKPMKDDPTNPFGSIVRQIADKEGNVSSAMNIVGQKEGAGIEGAWGEWSKSLSSQVLSKQPPSLAKGQLDMTYERKRKELDEILALTNPTVKKKLLESFADDVDSSAVHLKAAAMPRQATQVLMPVNTLKKTEIYAPNFRDGERVALIRYPHGGTFEIPELTVNNRHVPAQKLLGKQAKDAVGIHHSVAERLSGADFDGDTVLVIPNSSGAIKTTPPLEGLKGFDSKSYKIPDGSSTPRMKKSRTQTEMGDITNLISDMTIRGANSAEIARAVRHSMVVIDAEKHGLDYKASARDNGIAALKERYQGGSNKGASTLITRAKSTQYVDARRARRASEGGPIDPSTGKKVFVPTGETRVDKRTGKEVPVQIKSRKLYETDNAHTLSSGTTIERIYADHSNRLKGLGNESRKATLSVKPIPYSPSAKAAYKKEVDDLNAKLNTALKNAPLERQAQLLANTIVRQKRAANPDMDAAQLKKEKAIALADARARTGAKKQRVELTAKEWEAIQAGAISASKLERILANADGDQVKALATPRTPKLMTSVKTTRARSMAAQGYTQAEIADALGVSLSTLKAVL